MHSNCHKKILFILKKRHLGYGSGGISVGLSVSACMVINALREYGYECSIKEVIDGNGIDKEIYNYKPNFVIIEALFATPEKVLELIKRYPKIIFTVRAHSCIPFISMEGIAFDWLNRYNHIQETNQNFTVSANDIRLVEELNLSLGYKIDYLPNIYKPSETFSYKEKREDKDIINIGCPSSIRPLKNILAQAVSAIIFANKINKTLRFHILGNRIEQQGENTLKNLKALFEYTDHELISHDWMDHETFIKKFVKKMDMGMMLSFTESFCISGADFVYNDIPFLGSAEIKFLIPDYQAITTEYKDIVEKLEFAWQMRHINFHYLNKLKLFNSNKKSIKAWLKYLG